MHQTTLTRAPALSPSPLLSALRADAPIYCFIAAYACAVALLGSSIGVERKVLPASFYLGALGGVVYLLVLLVIATGLLAMLSRKPLQAWKSHLLTVAGLMPGVLMFLALRVFMGVFSSGKQMLTDIVPFYADPALARLDALLHGGDPWKLAHAVMPQAFVPVLEKLYLLAWGGVMIASTLAALFLPKLRHLRQRYLWSFLVIWVLLGNAVAGAVMSAGPVFYERVTGDPQFAALTHYLATQTGQGWVQDFVWRSYVGQGPGMTGGGISAFPSLHVASTTLCALLALHAGRWVGWITVSYAAAILFGSVFLGWHYAVDGYFSILATVAVWKALARIQRA